MSENDKKNLLNELIDDAVQSDNNHDGGDRFAELVTMFGGGVI